MLVTRPSITCSGPASARRRGTPSGQIAMTCVGTGRNCDGRNTDGVTRTVWMRPLNHDTRFCRTPIEVCPLTSGPNVTSPLPCSTPFT